MSRPKYWIALFIVVSVAFQVRPSTNPLSRYAMIAAMVSDGTFRIDRHRDVTIDWSLTPDGHYYSNKAPGPALAAYPLAWAYTRVAEPSMRPLLLFLSTILQILPFALLVGLGASWLSARGVSAAAVSFFTIAALFGNTASLFMNSFFGHGMAAVCVLAMALALLRRNDVWAGFFFGWAMLSDYGAALLLPGVAYYIYKERLSFARFAAGGVFPGALWVWYHTVCFGGPFTLPQKFQNPVFVDDAGGVMRELPSLGALVELLVGPSRGILWTQPWVLVFAVARPRPALLLSGLGLLLWMNSAFGNWHAGDTPGPRYLALVFPTIALIAALAYDKLGRGTRIAMWAGLAVSVVFYVLFFAAPLMAPPGTALWPFYLSLTFGSPDVPQVVAYVISHSATRFALLAPLFVLVAWRALPRLALRH